MTYFDELIETQFKALQEQGLSQKQEHTKAINYSELVGQLEKGYEGLRRVIFEALLKHQLKLSDIPQELRLSNLDCDGYFSLAAHRYASDSSDTTYLTEVLSTMYEDASYGVTQGIINYREFHELICAWLNYLDYDKIEFKGDKDFELYFQEQKERHRSFFEAFGL